MVLVMLWVVGVEGVLPAVGVLLFASRVMVAMVMMAMHAMLMLMAVVTFTVMHVLWISRSCW